MRRNKLSDTKKERMKERSRLNRTNEPEPQHEDLIAFEDVENDIHSNHSVETVDVLDIYNHPSDNEIFHEPEMTILHDVNDLPSVTKAHERLVIADEEVWKERRRELKDSIIRSMYPKLIETCQSCSISLSTIQCLTCAISQCHQCSASHHLSRHCHLLVKFDAVHGRVPIAHTIKNLSNCDAACIKTKDTTIQLIDVYGIVHCSILIKASETVSLRQCKCSFNSLGTIGYFPSTRGGLINAAFSTNLLKLLRTLNLKCAISTTAFYQTLNGILPYF